MTKQAVKHDLDMAVRLLNENIRVHLHAERQATDYNLNLALVHIVQALARIADDIDSIEHRVSRM